MTVTNESAPSSMYRPHLGRRARRPARARLGEPRGRGHLPLALRRGPRGLGGRARLGVYPIATLEKQLPTMIGNLV
jgi:hypothetical protein